MGEYDISQWQLAGTWIHTPSDPKMATGVRTGFRGQYPYKMGALNRPAWRAQYYPVKEAFQPEHQKNVTKRAQDCPVK